jgi:hypothetical protein
VRLCSDVDRYDSVLSPATVESSTRSTPSSSSSRDHFQQEEEEEEPCRRARAAEEWLFRGGGGAEAEAVVTCEETAAEEWLSRGVVLLSSSPSSTQQQQALGQYSDQHDEASNGLSCSNPITLRDRFLQRRLRKEQGEPRYASDSRMTTTTTTTLQEKQESTHDTTPTVAARAPNDDLPPPPETLASSSSLSTPIWMETKDRFDNFMDNDPHYTKPVTTTTSSTSTSTVAKIVQVFSQNGNSSRDHAKKSAAHVASLLSLSRRQVRLSSSTKSKENSIMLHIYDLFPTETIMQLGWGCEFPIGQCFNAMNDGLYELGTGAYHCGIEV